MAVGLDLLGVLFEGGGEAAVALGVGYEIEVVGLGGVMAALSAATPGLQMGPGGRPVWR